VIDSTVELLRLEIHDRRASGCCMGQSAPAVMQTAGKGCRRLLPNEGPLQCMMEQSFDSVLEIKISESLLFGTAGSPAAESAARFTAISNLHIPDCTITGPPADGKRRPITAH
jgi:hypothetical protein